MDEYDDTIHEGGLPSGIGRWLPSVVVLGVVTGFVALAWYAYHAGTQSVKDEDLLVVEADKTPMKEKPLDPGGMQFPNQDKTIFETFAGNAPPQPAKVERVLPAPEEPVVVAADTSGTTTWINDKLHKNTEEAQNSDSAKPEQVIGTPEDNAKHSVVEKPPAPAQAADKPVVETKPLQNDEPPESYVAKPTVTPTPKHTDVTKAPAKPKPVALPAAAVHHDGAFKAQLGAYRSEKEAKDAWSKMQKKQTALSGMAPVIVKADLGDRGVYYRLRVGGFASAAEVSTFCGKLTGGGQPCILSAAK